jgi:hypothetical protein
MFFPALICKRGQIMKANNEACAAETHLRMFMGEGSQRSIVGRSIRLWAGQPRVKIPVGMRDFLFFTIAQCGSGAHPASRSVWCYPGVKWPSHQVKHSLPFSAENKNE